MLINSPAPLRPPAISLRRRTPPLVLSYLWEANTQRVRDSVRCPLVSSPYMEALSFCCGGSSANSILLKSKRSNAPCQLSISKSVSLQSNNSLQWRGFCMIKTTSPNICCKDKEHKLNAVNPNLADPVVSLSRKKLAVFVSGGGSNFRAIHEATLVGSVVGDVAVLVTNKHACGGANYARDRGIPVVLFPKSKDEPDGMSPEDLVTRLREFGVDIIFLAGYLKLIPEELVKAFPKSIVNIHPSLLPAFGGKGYYGMKVHKAVIASGARYSGATIHFVDEEYDQGRILAQRVVPVLANDTADLLAARVLREEHCLYVEVAAALCEDRIVWRDDGVPLIQSKEDPQNYS
ncbi:hypothetical protein V2J09_024084 [Rumex salicifolius]